MTIATEAKTKQREMQAGVMLAVDVTDWMQELEEENPNLADREQAITTQMERRFSPQKMGRMIVAGREVGKAEATLVPPTKLLIQTGAASHWVQSLVRERETFDLDNGKEVSVRRYVGTGLLEDLGETDDGSWVAAENPVAAERATKYLTQVVPGYIWGRLGILAANGGQVQAAADALKASIDDMVARLV
jgi:hypothetical protein